MARRWARRILLGLALGSFPSVASAEAPGAGSAGSRLSSEERRALLARKVVSRPSTFTRGLEGRYVGGLSYGVVRAEPVEVLQALASIESLPRVLPATLSAKLVSREGRRARVELVQGKAPFTARYTLILEQSESGIRFWLDPTRPHDIKDVWGFFRVEPFGFGRSVVTVAVALDLGPGFARALFEARVQRSILRTPARIRDFVEPRALALAR